MTVRGSGSDPAEHQRNVASTTDRAIRARDDARNVAQRLVSTAQDLATTYDRLAETREAALPDSECECSAVQQRPDPIVDHVAEAEGVAAQRLEAAVDRLGRP